MNGIRLSHGTVFVSDGLFTVRLLPTGECGPSPVLLSSLEWELRTEPPHTWDYMTDGEIRALPGGGFEKICAAFEKMYGVTETWKSADMLFLSAEDFYEKSRKYAKFSRAEEAELAELAKNGDDAAREKLVSSYLPTVASFARKTQKNCSLELIYRLIDALEKEIDRFDGGFDRRLTFAMRKTLTEYIADEEQS